MLGSVFSDVESARVSQWLNLAGGLRTFVWELARLPEVDRLLRECDAQSGRSAVLERVLSLANETIDLRYKHPRDTALAIYMWVLAVKDPGLARVAAETIAATPQCWWSRRVAVTVLPRAASTESTTTVNAVPGQPSGGVQVVDMQASREQMMLNTKLRFYVATVFDAGRNASSSDSEAMPNVVFFAPDSKRRTFVIDAGRRDGSDVVSRLTGAGT